MWKFVLAFFVVGAFVVSHQSEIEARCYSKGDARVCFSSERRYFVDVSEFRLLMEGDGWKEIDIGSSRNQIGGKFVPACAVMVSAWGLFDIDCLVSEREGEILSFAAEKSGGAIRAIQEFEKALSESKKPEPGNRKPEKMNTSRLWT